LTRYATSTLAAALCLSALLALPALALGQADGVTGGTAAPDPSVPRSGAATPAGSGSLKAGPGVLLGRRQLATGTVPGLRGGDSVLLQRSDAAQGWVTLARGTAKAGGAVSIVWRADRSGKFRLRAVPGDAQAAQAGGDPAPVVPVTVYTTAIASEYGVTGPRPGATACGVPLLATTLGVAHKTLPCGTRVEFFYRGRTVTVPVIDRGPYIAGREWDLTTAAARRLRFSGLDRVGSIRLAGRVDLRRR